VLAQKSEYSSSSSSIRFFTVSQAQNNPPSAYIDSISPSPATQGQSVSFQGHGSDSDGSIVAYNWRSSINGQLSTLSSFSTSGLSVGAHTIYFKVQDNSGSWSTEATATLTINLPLPPPPSLVSPAQGATGVGLTPTLSWNAVSGSCDGYTVRILRLVDFWTVEAVVHVDLGVVTSYSVPSGKLASATTYVWVVWAHNGAGFSPYSTRYFSTAGSAPSTPSLVSPADGATGVGLTPTLSWSAVSGPCDGYAARIIEASTGSAVLHVNLRVVTSYTVPSGKLVSSKTYIWVVWAHNGAGWSPYSTRTFTTA